MKILYVFVSSCVPVLEIEGVDAVTGTGGANRRMGARIISLVFLSSKETYAYRTAAIKNALVAAAAASRVTWRRCAVLKIMVEHHHNQIRRRREAGRSRFMAAQRGQQLWGRRQVGDAEQGQRRKLRVQQYKAPEIEWVHEDEEGGGAEFPRGRR